MAAKASTVAKERPERIVTEAVKIRQSDKVTIALMSAATASVRLPRLTSMVFDV
jgi:hypothetical protein